MTESREVVSLREHMESQLHAMDRRIADYREAYQAADKVNSMEVNRRLDLLNNEAGRLLAAISEMKLNYVGKDVYLSEQKNVNAKLESLLHTRANYEGRSSAYAFVIATLVSLAVSIISAYLKS